MSPALCFRILEHLAEMGLLKDSDTILDCMAGTGLTAICAGAKGYKAITVELENKFVDFQAKNKEYAERRLYKKLDWTILQGDSRKLSTLLTERGLVTLTSPPYTNLELAAGQQKVRKEGISRLYDKDLGPKYGASAGQIGNLKDTPLVTVCSPPYAEAQTGGGISKAMRGEGNYNVTTKMPGSCYQPSEHSVNPDNIGNLPDKPLVSVMSPPYDGQVSASNSDPHPEKQMSTPAGRQYGHTEGQIGDTESETYLSAMSQVYSEIAKVSNVLAIVLKNPTRNGKIRRLDTDTIKILEATGWKIHCQHRALLFEEQEQGDMFNGSQKKVKGRLSFFKRLSYQKGQPVASWEDVLIAVRV